MQGKEYLFTGQEAPESGFKGTYIQGGGSQFSGKAF